MESHVYMRNRCEIDRNSLANIALLPRTALVATTTTIITIFIAKGLQTENMGITAGATIAEVCHGHHNPYRQLIGYKAFCEVLEGFELRCRMSCPCQVCLANYESGLDLSHL